MLKEKKVILISTCASLVLAVILAALQFLPYWTFTGEECGEQTITMADYIWFPNSEISDEFEELVKDEVYAPAPGEKKLTDHEVVNEIVMFPAIAFGLCVAAFVVSILTRKLLFVPAVCAIIASVASLLSYLLNPALTAFTGSWMLHVIVVAVVLVVALGLLAVNILTKVRGSKAEVTA